jgi:thiopurine S-methyltransferase
MEPGFWQQRWATGQVGWHREEVNEAVSANLDRLTSGRRSRILVPLCGKSRDLVYFARAGHDVVGIELVEQAVHEFFAEHDAKPTVVRGPRATRYRARSLTILQADFFDVTRDDVGEVDCAYDRAALIALPPEDRGRYVSHLLELLPSGAPILLVTLDYDDSATSGPPFAVSDEEVHERFGPSCAVERLAHGATRDVSERLRDAGARESTWLLTRH